MTQRRCAGWLTSHAECVLHEQVSAPPADVLAFYTDLRNLVTVHPLVVSVRVTAHVPLADGYRRTYRVRDRIPFGPFILPTSYLVHLTVSDDGQVQSEARQFPGVRLHGVVSFEPVDGGTRLVEQLRIHAPRPLTSVTTRTAVAAHTEMLAGIRRRFGG